MEKTERFYFNRSSNGGDHFGGFSRDDPKFMVQTENAHIAEAKP